VGARAFARQANATHLKLSVGGSKSGKSSANRTSSVSQQEGERDALIQVCEHIENTQAHETVVGKRVEHAPLLSGTASLLPSWNTMGKGSPQYRWCVSA
jgi:hypothetical protein